MNEPEGYEAIAFYECEFQTKNLQLALPVCFNSCVFHSEWIHFDLTLLTEKQEAYYQGCELEKSLILKGNINNKVFLNGNKFHASLIVDEVDFSARAIWNKLPVKLLEVLNSNFKDKFELKEVKLDKLILKDANFHHVADFYESDFLEVNIEKCIFKDFSAFEGCNFGTPIEGTASSSKAQFKYVTFKDFVNFRRAKFYCGVSLENINTVVQPNFLGADFKLLAQQTTDRETFRIVKHSFDSVGNHIEANKYFAYEMEAYRRELKEGKCSGLIKPDTSLDDKIIANKEVSYEEKSSPHIHGRI